MQNRRSASTDGNLHEDRQSGCRKAPMIDVSFHEFTLADLADLHGWIGDLF